MALIQSSYTGSKVAILANLPLLRRNPSSSSNAYLPSPHQHVNPLASLEHRLDLFAWAHVNGLEFRSRRSRIICTYTVHYCIPGIFNLATSGIVLPIRSFLPVRRRNRSLFVLGFQPEFQVYIAWQPSQVAIPQPQYDFGDHLRQAPSGYAGTSFLPNRR